MTIGILLHVITVGPIASVEASANHWVSGVIDLAHGGVYYGDSLEHSMHQSTRKLLEAYITPIVLSLTHHSLRHVTQIENWSCRDFALRSIYHHMNPDRYPVLAHRQSAVLVNQWSWFEKLICEFDEKVCSKCYPLPRSLTFHIRVGVSCSSILTLFQKALSSGKHNTPECIVLMSCGLRHFSIFPLYLSLQ